MPTLPEVSSVGRVNPAASRAQAIAGPRDQSGAALETVGDSLFQSGQRLQQAEERVRTREDAVEVARRINDYTERANAELRRLQTEDDLSKSATVDGFGKFLGKLRDEAFGDFGGSEDARSRLDVRIEGISASIADRAAVMSLAAQRKVVTDRLGDGLRGLTSLALQSPSTLGEQFARLDSLIDDLAPGMTSDEEESFRLSGRQEITLSAVNGLMQRGAVTEARQLIQDTPGVMDTLSPSQQRQMQTRFASFEREQTKAVREFQGRVAIFEQAKGGKATVEERRRIANTFLDIQEPKAQTDAGKEIQDRALFVRQFGEDSEQVAAFDDAVGDDKDPSLSDVAGIRKEFTKQATSFVAVRDSFNSIQQVAQNPSAAGDLTLLVSFMKMIDPGSVVREGELATAEQARGVPEGVLNFYNRLVSGERMTERQRADFVTQAQTLMAARLSTHIILENQFRDVAIRNNINPQDVVIDLVGPLRGQGQVVADGLPQRPRFSLTGQRLDTPAQSAGRQVVQNEDGTVSTERSITVTDERINDGRPTNIPSMFDGKQVSEEEAIKRIVEAGGKDPETGRDLPAFETIESAVDAARQRSDNLGAAPEGVDQEIWNVMTPEERALWQN